MSKIRKTVPDLQPGTQYAIRVRAKNFIETSHWSNRQLFTTTTDGIPITTPTGVTWVVNGDSFHGEWNPVTTNTSGQTVAVVRYEVQLTAGATTRIVSVPANDASSKGTFDLSFNDNVALFATPQPAITMSVRAVDNHELKSAFSSGILATNPPPGPPTSPVVTPGTDSLDISWTPPSDTDLIGYAVYTGASSGFTPSAGNRIFSGDATRFSYTTTTYTLQYFKIRAVDKFGQESTDLLTSGTPISPFIVDITPPATPTALAATLTNDANGLGAKAAVTWTMSSPPSDLAGFNIRFRAVSTTNYQYMTGIDPADRAAQIIIDTPYTNYEFQIQAFDFTDNKSAWSSTYTATSPANAAPGNIASMSSVAGNNNIIYSWTAVSDQDIKNYEVTFSTSATFASGNITYLTGTATTLTVGGLSYGTTYYARVRAVDLGGNTSASWSATNTTTTGSAPGTSDGSAPASSPNAPNVLGGLSYLYITWTAITNNDPVTYEVHLSTTTGFTPSGATKVTEVMGTSAVVDVLPGTTTPLSYGTTYYIKLIAKDKDGAAAAGTQGSGTISKVASTDVTSIGADLIVPGTGFVNALVVNSGGSIQSSNWVSLTTGWKISPTGIELNDTGSKIKVDALQAGTIGGVSGAGAIQVAAGTSIIMNGGYLKSNTYTGTTQATNPSGAGFYLGNDGIRIDTGKVAAEAFTGGSFSTGTITMAGGSITGGSWTLNSSGLTIPAGAITAASLTLQNSPNIIPAPYATFEVTTNAQFTFVNGGLHGPNSNAKFGSQSYSTLFNLTAASNQLYLGTSTTNYNIVVEAGKSYIVSGYVWVAGTTATPVIIKVKYSDGTSATVATPSLSTSMTPATAVRFSNVMTIPAGVTGMLIYIDTGTTTGTSMGYNIDGFMVEEKVGNSSSPSAWRPGGMTQIDGAMISTGQIISTSTTVVNGNTIPVWSIPLNGAASFANLQVRGNAVMGITGDGAATTLSSANYIAGTQGWQLRSDGSGELRNLDANSLNGASIQAGTITGSKILARSITADKITIGDTSNLIQDPNMDGFGTWSAAAGTSQWSYAAGIASPVAGDNNVKVLRFISGGVYTEMAERLIPVTPGDTYIFSYWVRHQGATDTAGTVYNRIRWYDASSTTTGVTDQALVYASFSGATWYQIVNQATVPAGVYYAQPQIIPYLVTTGAYYEFDVASFVRMVPAVQTSSSGLRIELATSANAFQSGQQWANIAFYSGNAGWDPGLLWANYIAGTPNQGFLSLVAPYPTGSSTAAARIIMSSYSDGTRGIQLISETLTFNANKLYTDASGTASFDFNLVGSTTVYSFRDSGANRINMSFFGGVHAAAHQISARNNSGGAYNMELYGSEIYITMPTASEDIFFGVTSSGTRPGIYSITNNMGIVFKTNEMAAANHANSLVQFEASVVKANGVTLTSDIRQKSNLEEVNGATALKAIRKIPVYDYDMDLGPGRGVEKRRGIVAQDWAKHLKWATDKNSEGNLGIDLYSLVSTHLAGTKELDAEVTALKAEVAALRSLLEAK